MRHPSTEAYKLLGGARSWCQNDGFQESSHWWIFPGTSATSVLVSTVSHSYPLPPQETLQDQQLGLAQAPSSHCFFPWVLVCTRPCVHPPRMESLFPSVLWTSCNQAPLGGSEVSSSWCQTPRLGELTWGSELSLLWENFCDIIVLQFVDCPPGGYGIWLYHKCTPPTISLGFFFMSVDLEHIFW